MDTLQGGSNLTPEKAWKAALTDLEGQMTKATFNTWLKDAQFLRLAEGEVFHIGVRNEFAKDWLENRLADSVVRTLEVIWQRPVQIVFEVLPESVTRGNPPRSNGNGNGASPTPPEQDVFVEVVQFDPIPKAGFLMLGHYHNLYWRAYLDGVAGRMGVTTPKPFDLWLVLVSWQNVKRTSRLNIEELCDFYANGSRNQLFGRLRGGRRQVGDLEVLEQEGLVSYEITGRTKNREYTVKVVGEHLPILTPKQIQQLPKGLQRSHSALLHSCKMSLSQWRQMRVESLLLTENSDKK